MAATDRGPLQAARAAFAQARTDLIDQLFAFERATNELREARRRLAPGSDLAEFEEALDLAKTGMLQARSNEAARNVELQAALAAWLPAGYAALDMAEEDISRLESTAPIVLFPVRLETRFDGGLLKVRVFPDEIFLSVHETALTVEERDAAEHYYRELNAENNEPALWRDIVARFGVQRSAYILRQMLPVFGDPGSESMWSASSSTCGGTIYGGNNEDLYFPAVQLRSAAWTRPGEAVLPDRWIVVTIRGSSRSFTLGNPILEPLALTPDPKLPDESSLSDLEPAPGVSYHVDDNLRWSVDFARAVQVGMGIEVPLQGQDGTLGFDRVIVVGVKSSMTALETSRLLEKLLDAHHYTRGLAILRQGSPTNNTENQTTPYPPQENAGELSFGIERQRAPLDRDFAHHCLPHDTDGYALASMLGVPSGVMANVERAYEKEIVRARLMNQALWPGTLGYFMRHLMDSAHTDGYPIFTPSQIEEARLYFHNFVLARGSAPAFRIGGTPYGVLPIASLDYWQERDYGSSSSLDERMQAVEQALIQPLRRLSAFWLEGVGEIPCIEPGAVKPDVQLARVLSNYPSAREFWLRPGVTGTFTLMEYLLQGWDPRATWDDLNRQSRATFGRLGFESWRPALGTTRWQEQSVLWPLPRVTTELSETATLSPNFISAIPALQAQTLNEGSHPSVPPGGSLLYTLLRHSTLAEYSRIAAEQTATTWTDLWIFDDVATKIIPSVYSLDSEGALKPLASAHLQAIEGLAFAPTAELDRLFSETMDVVSRRLDAWVTAVASRRVRDMRRAQESTHLATVGDFLGGYGWLEEVRPVTRATEVLGGRTVEIQPHNGGFVHAPSMSHAAAAAVLRNGHLSYRNDDPAAHAVDLSSKRVREGRAMFEAVRNGQPVGALFGYQFERALHESYPGTSGLDELRFGLRKRFPLVANKTGHDGDEPAEAIAARNVVDGEQLLLAYRNNQLDFAGDPSLPSPGTSQYNAVVAELRKLEQRYDAGADLLTAEAVFQLVRGNIDGAFATMANVVDGKPPPDTIISKSARGGTGISHRVALVFPANLSLTLPTTWPVATPRALAEPVLDAWLGSLVGDPTGVTASVTYLDAEGATIPAGGGGTPVDAVSVTLAELGLRPLDLLALAEVVAESSKGSTLDRRIVTVALADPTRAPTVTPATYRVEYPTSGGRSFARTLEVLQAAHVVLKASRPLELADLLPPAEAAEGVEEEASYPVGALTALAFYQRGQVAAGALKNARDALEGAIGAESGVRAALLNAAHFSPQSAFPEPSVGDSALKPVAEAILKDLNRRAAKLPEPYQPIDDPPEFKPSKELLAHGKQTLELVFGASFPALPDVDPPRPAEIGLSLAARPTLLDGDDGAPDRYLQQMMRSRERLGRYRKLNLYARTRGLGRPRVDVLQLPHVPGEKWLGLPFDAPPEEGRAAVLLLSYAESLDPGVAWRGLVIDNWTEVIPNQKEETGFAFHYKSPKAQAPQAVLVAAPSRNAASWSFAELLASLEQTMDLMKIRAIESEYLDMGQLIPAVVLGDNPNIENTVTSSIFGSTVRRDRQDLNDG